MIVTGNWDHGILIVMGQLHDSILKLDIMLMSPLVPVFLGNSFDGTTAVPTIGMVSDWPKVIASRCECAFLGSFPTHLGE